MQKYMLGGVFTGDPISLACGNIYSTVTGESYATLIDNFFVGLPEGEGKVRIWSMQSFGHPQRCVSWNPTIKSRI